MPAFLFLLALLLLACDPTPPITPEAPPDGGQGGASSSSGVSSSVASSGSQGAGVGGSGGAGGSLSCDPCQDVDGSRIVHQRHVTTTFDGYKHVVDWGNMLDTLRGESCSPRLAADGVLRCLPVAQSPVFYYADASCSTPLFLVAVGGCSKPPLYVGEAVTLPGQCGTGSRVRKLAGEHVGDVHMLTGATCVKVTTPPPNLYAAGAEVTPGAFAVVEQVEAP